MSLRFSVLSLVSFLLLFSLFSCKDDTGDIIKIDPPIVKDPDPDNPDASQSDSLFYISPNGGTAM